MVTMNQECVIGNEVKRKGLVNYLGQGESTLQFCITLALGNNTFKPCL